jgi:hypothetical protein
MARSGTRPTAGKETGDLQYANQQVYIDDKAVNPGVNDAWSSIVKFDDEYFPPDKTMSGAITYTIDATNAGTGNGRKDTIIGDGNTITFTGFTVKKSSLNVSSNVVTTAAGVEYTIIFLRTGSVSEVYLATNNTSGFTQLTQPQNFIASVDDQSLFISWSSVQSATGYVLEFYPDTDVGNWQAVPTYDGVSTNYTHSSLTNGTQYFYRVKATAIGYTDSSYSQTNATPSGTAYAFTNTHRLVIDANSEGIIFDNNAAIPTISGSDEIIAFEFWYTTPSSIPTLINLLQIRDDDDNSSVGSVAISETGGAIVGQFKSDGSNFINLQAAYTFATNTQYHIIVGKTAKSKESIYIYIDNVSKSGVRSETGTYDGFSLVGNFEINLANSSGGTGGLGKYDLFRIYHYDIASDGHTYLYNSGTPIGLSGKASLLNTCVQELLLNNNANADNIGVNGTPVGSITYESV